MYIIVLPVSGVFPQSISTLSGKPLFGYRSMVAATLFIASTRSWFGLLIVFLVIGGCK